MHREQGILLCRKNQHELDVLWFFLPPEGISVCLSSCISSTRCPAGVVLCLAATQICIECLMYIPKAECLSPQDTWPESSVCTCPDLRGTWTLKHQLTCPIKGDHMHAAACHFLTSPLVPLHICLLHKFSLLLSSSTLSGLASLRGFAYALHAQTVAPFTTTRTGPWSQIREELTIWLFL